LFKSEVSLDGLKQRACRFEKENKRRDA